MIAFYMIIIFALLLFPETCAQSARDALAVWALHVTPSLFPYMVFSKMLASRMKEMRFPPAVLCALIGMVGGSPSGAAMIASFRHRLSPKGMLSLCALTGTISPMFFIGTIGAWSSDVMLPKQLLFSQLFGAVLTAVCIYFSPYQFSVKTAGVPFQSDKDNPLTQSIDAILQIGGCIICYSVLAGLLRLLPLSACVSAAVHALFEVSGGIHAMLQAPFSKEVYKTFLAAVCGFGGFSILSQNSIFLKMSGIKTGLLVILALIRAFFSSLFMLAINAA